MLRAHYLALVCNLVLCGCASTPTRPDAVPPDRPIPEGFKRSECRLENSSGGTIQGAGGTPVVGADTSTRVVCNHAATHQSVYTCRTENGKELPLKDCCLDEDGTLIQYCTPMHTQ